MTAGGNCYVIKIDAKAKKLDVYSGHVAGFLDWQMGLDYSSPPAERGRCWHCD